MRLGTSDLVNAYHRIDLGNPHRRQFVDCTMAVDEKLAIAFHTYMTECSGMP